MKRKTGKKTSFVGRRFDCCCCYHHGSINYNFKREYPLSFNRSIPPRVIVMVQVRVKFSYTMRCANDVGDYKIYLRFKTYKRNDVYEHTSYFFPFVIFFSYHGALQNFIRYRSRWNALVELVDLQKLHRNRTNLYSRGLFRNWYE